MSKHYGDSLELKWWPMPISNQDEALYEVPGEAKT